MISTVWGVGRKNSLQLEWFQAPPFKVTGVPCLAPFPFLPTLNISAILISPKQWFFKVTSLYQNLEWPPTHKTDQTSEPGGLSSAPVSSGSFPNIPSLCQPNKTSYSLYSERLPYTLPFLSHLCLHHSPNLEGNFSSLALLLRPRARSTLPIGPSFDGMWSLIFFFLCILCPTSATTLYLPPRTQLCICSEP